MYKLDLKIHYDWCSTDTDQNQINLISSYAHTILYSSPVRDLRSEVCGWKKRCLLSNVLITCFMKLPHGSVMVTIIIRHRIDYWLGYSNAWNG